MCLHTRGIAGRINLINLDNSVLFQTAVALTADIADSQLRAGGLVLFLFSLVAGSGDHSSSQNGLLIQIQLGAAFAQVMLLHTGLGTGRRFAVNMGQLILTMIADRHLHSHLAGVFLAVSGGSGDRSSTLAHSSNSAVHDSGNLIVAGRPGNGLVGRVVRRDSRGQRAGLAHFQIQGLGRDGNGSDSNNRNTRGNSNRSNCGRIIQISIASHITNCYIRQRDRIFANIRVLGL